MAPFDVGDQGKMAVFQDPTGRLHLGAGRREACAASCHISQAPSTGPSSTRATSRRRCPSTRRSFGWAEEDASGRPSQPPYTEFQLDGESIAGAWEMNPMVPAKVPDLLAGLLPASPTSTRGSDAPSSGGEGDGRAAGHARRPLRDREGPAGRELRPAAPGGSRGLAARRVLVAV